MTDANSTFRSSIPAEEVHRNAERDETPTVYDHPTIVAPSELMSIAMLESPPSVPMSTIPVA